MNAAHEAMLSARRTWRIVAFSGASALALAMHASPLRSETESPQSILTAAIAFTDAQRQAEEFLAHHRSITLTVEQQHLMDRALSTIPAPCCRENPIATCCCPCNLAKSTWGLSKFLIAHRHASVADVRAAAVRWLSFVNPAGASGDACFTGGCNRPLAQNGCGGMHDDSVVAR